MLLNSPLHPHPLYGSEVTPPEPLLPSLPPPFAFLGISVLTKGPEQDKVKPGVSTVMLEMLCAAQRTGTAERGQAFCLDRRCH